MSFKKINLKSANPAINSTGIKVSLMQRKGSHARVHFSFTKQIVDDLKFIEGDKFGIYFGTDEHHGLIRIVREKNGDLELKLRNDVHMKSWRFSVHHQPQFVNRAEHSQYVQYKMLDSKTLQIRLPKWADQTKPTERQIDNARTKAAVAIVKNSSKGI